MDGFAISIIIVIAVIAIVALTRPQTSSNTGRSIEFTNLNQTLEALPNYHNHFHARQVKELSGILYIQVPKLVPGETTDIVFNESDGENYTVNLSIYSGYTIDDSLNGLSPLQPGKVVHIYCSSWGTEKLRLFGTVLN